MDLLRYIISIYAYQLNRIIPLPQFRFNKKREYQFIKAELKHKELANYLEKLCKEKKGFLLFSEYAEVVMYSKFGFCSRHNKRFGKTDTHNLWPKAIISLCKKGGFRNIIEFGPGDGSLGVNIIKQDPSLYWIGIESNKALHQIIKKNFARKKISTFSILEAVDSKVKLPEHSLLLFPYCLDSIAPEIFTNINPEKNIPTTIVGIQVKNGLLQEIPLKEEQLKTRGITFKNGIYKKHNNSFVVKKWKLYSLQKAYIPVNALLYLSHIVQNFQKKSAVLIMDEMHPFPTTNYFDHYLIPRNLDSYSRDCLNSQKTYQSASDILYYFPIYFQTIIDFLTYLGFTNTIHDIEKKLSDRLEGTQKELKPGLYFNTAIFAKDKNKRAPKKPFSLDFSS